ncbi:mycothiol transferase [Luteococcus sp. Sow4_B9]|uniref:mycothiol transferase n=1 Tax=Luteococcus sp. Sow4_B9 TaxID=3438792 RepID=UPI003F9D96E0
MYLPQIDDERTTLCNFLEVQLDAARPAKLRYLYVHHVEEFARHAGHADIIREEIDGARAAELWLASEGLPGNDFVTPWEPVQ